MDALTALSALAEPCYAVDAGHGPELTTDPAGTTKAMIGCNESAGRACAEDSCA